MATAAPDPFLVAADLFDPPEDPYQEDPVGFARDVLGFHPWSKQRQVMESVRDHARTTVRACHGVGKTASAAQVALWFLGTHPNSRVITTAPTWAQVEQLLWREIRAAVFRAHAAGQAAVFPRPSATKLEIGDQWFAIGLSTNEPERFQGHHADHILLIVDEASGVDERIFEAAEGFLTAEGAKVLLIGNPTKVGGQFHRSHTVERPTWNTIHIAAEDSPNYTGEPVPAHVARSLPHPDWVAEKAAQWGRDSPMFQVRVDGQFPSEAENAVIALHHVEAAQARELPGDPSRDRRITIACDVARFGDDETVIAQRVGHEVRIVERYVGKRPPGTATGSQTGDLVQTAGLIARHASRHPRHVTTIVVDDTGVGGGVTDILRSDGWEVTAFNAGNTAIEADEYPNRRSELWFTMADEIAGLDLDPDEQLTADLSAPVYTFDKHGRRVVEPKSTTKQRLGRSPDRADAVLLTLVKPLPSGVVVVPQPRTRQRKPSAVPADERRDLQQILNDPM